MTELEELLKRLEMDLRSARDQRAQAITAMNVADAKIGVIADFIDDIRGLLRAKT